MFFVTLTKCTLVQGPYPGCPLSFLLLSLPIFTCWPPSCHWGLSLSILSDRPPWPHVVGICPLDALSTLGDPVRCSRKVTCLHCHHLPASCGVQPIRSASRRWEGEMRLRSTHILLPSFIPVGSLLPGCVPYAQVMAATQQPSLIPLSLSLPPLLFLLLFLFLPPFSPLSLPPLPRPLPPILFS